MFVRFERKPIEWFFSETGKETFDLCLSNFEEMCETLLYEGKGELAEAGIDREAYEEDGVASVITKICGISIAGGYKAKKFWLIKFFYEYLDALDEGFCMYTRAISFSQPLYWLSALVAATDDTDGRYLLPYPNCLKLENNPLLYYLVTAKQSFAKMNIFFGDFIDTITGQMIIKYLYNCATNGIDASKEEWLYDTSFFFTPFDELIRDEEMYHKIKKTAKYKEHLNRWAVAE